MYALRNIIHRLMEQANAEGAGSGGGAGGDSAGAGDGQANNAPSADDAAIEARARDWGWAPRDKWKGTPDSWLDAKAFVQRGEQVLPILQSNYRKTELELRQLRQQHQNTVQQLQSATESIQVLTNISTETSRAAAKEKRRELLRQQAQARTDGNAELEVDLGEQIADVTAEINAPVTKPAKSAGGNGQQGNRGAGGNGAGEGQGDTSQNQDPTQDPAYQAFVAENSWFGSDIRRTSLATAIGQEIRRDPALAGLQGKAFFDRVAQEVNKIFDPPRQQQGGSKVESGAGGGGGGKGGAFVDPTTGKGYNDLPPEAKSACDRQAQWCVGEGPGKAFKTKEEWTKYYVTMYFNS